MYLLPLGMSFQEYYSWLQRKYPLYLYPDFAISTIYEFCEP